MTLSDITLYYPHDVRAAFQMYRFLSGATDQGPSIKVANEKEIVALARADKLDAAFISVLAYKDFPETFSILETGTVFSPDEEKLLVEGSSSENVRTLARQLLSNTPTDTANTGKSVGASWKERYSHPLPEAIFCIHKKFGEGKKQEFESMLKESRDGALKFKQRALQYAVNFSEIFEMKQAEQFCRQHFTPLTESLGVDGRSALDFFLKQA